MCGSCGENSREHIYAVDKNRSSLQDKPSYSELFRIKT